MRVLFLITCLFCVIPDAGAQQIDALTFNIRYDNPRDGKDAWPKRQEMVGQWLREQAPDVVGLQEAKRHQIDDIRKIATLYSEHGVGRDDGKSAGEHCTILFKAGRFALDQKECGTFWLSDTPAKIASKSWGNGIPRICTWARLVEKKSKRAFYVYNVHWDHRSQPSRVGAARLIIERIAKRKYPKEPVILMGDFNADESNPAILALKSKPLELVDSYRVVKPEEKAVRTFHGFRGGKAAGGKIDHVFVLPGSAKVKSASIVRYHREGRYLSDHYPVRALLLF
jgi:endonuclease/exonuclease/phosphatase family metal-dependent hydrolase